MTTETKTNRAGKPYAIRSSATRAAKQDGFAPEQITVREVEGGFAYFINEPSLAAKAEVAGEPEQVVEAIRVAEQAAATPAPVEVVDAHTAEAKLAAGLAAREAQAPQDTPPTAAPTAPDRKGKSTVEGPTKLVWAIADEMFAANPDTKRKDVIAAAQARGIAYYTARTQYQQWLTATKASKKD
jgi:hypothetical protein